MMPNEAYPVTKRSFYTNSLQERTPSRHNHDMESLARHSLGTTRNNSQNIPNQPVRVYRYIINHTVRQTADSSDTSCYKDKIIPANFQN